MCQRVLTIRGRSGLELFARLSQTDRVLCPKPIQVILFVPPRPPTDAARVRIFLDSFGLASSPPLRRARDPDPQRDFEPVRFVA